MVTGAGTLETDQKYKILFLTDVVEPFQTGGVEHRVFSLAKELAKRHTLYILTSMTEKMMIKEGVTFLKSVPLVSNRIPGRRSLFQSFLYSCSLFFTPILKRKFDIIIVESIPYIHLMPLFVRFIKKRSILVCDVHEVWIRYKGRGIKNNILTKTLIQIMLRMFINKADAIMAVSETTKASLKYVTGASLKEAFVVPNGIGSDPFNKKNTLQENRLNSKNIEYDFISLGRLDPIKRPMDFVMALDVLKREHHWNGKAAIVGTGSLMDRIMDLRSELKLQTNLKIMGYVDEYEKSRILASSNIYVLCSEREGFSISTLEAMSFGLPVIVSVPDFKEVFGVSDFVIEGFNGLFYKVADFKFLAKQMNSLLKNVNMVKYLSANAINTANKYLWGEISNNLLENLCNLINIDSRNNKCL